MNSDGKNEKLHHSVIRYLELFDSSTTYGKCAGKYARLSQLHKNKVASETYRIVVWDYLIRNSLLVNSRLDLFLKNGLTEPGKWTQRLFKLAAKFEHSWSELYSQFNLRDSSNLDISECIEGLTLLLSKIIKKLCKKTDSKNEVTEEINIFYKYCLENNIHIMILAAEDRDLDSLRGFGSSEQLSAIEDVLFLNKRRFPPGLVHTVYSNLIVDALAQGGAKNISDFTQKVALRNKAFLNLASKPNNDFQKEWDELVNLAHTRPNFRGEPHDVKDIITELDWGFLTNGYVETIEQYNNLTCPPLVSIFGDPGFGKTIHLKQFSNELVSRQYEKDLDEILIPIFVKAKVLARKIFEIATDPYGVIFENEEEYHGKSVSNPEMLMKILVESAADSDKYLSDDIRIMEDMVNNKAILSNYVILIDAYDECKSKSDRVQLINTIVDDIREVGMKVVVTCRNSHRDELITMIDEIGGIEQFTELDITFTPHDLQFEMPMKLANAWGISGEQISYEVGYRFNQFKEVLTHPLFVGLFCLLLQKGEIDKIDTTSSTALSLKGDIGVAHVQFLRKIIDIGLEINISDRTKEFDSAKIKMAFKHIAALNHLFAIEDFTLLIEALENSCGIILSADEIEILQNNLGIMYATDGNTLEWSHKTLSEVATGILLAETDYNIVSNTYSLNWRGFVSKGERGSILTKSWSECLILTIALISSESSKTKLVQSIINTLPKFGENSLHTIEMLYPKNAPTPLLFTDIDYDGEVYLKISDGLNQEEQHLAELFCESVNNQNLMFMLPFGFFKINSHNISSYYRSRWYGAGKGVDFISWPNTASVPLPIGDNELVKFALASRKFTLSRWIYSISRFLVYQERAGLIWSEEAVNRMQRLPHRKHHYAEPYLRPSEIDRHWDLIGNYIHAMKLEVDLEGLDRIEGIFSSHAVPVKIKQIFCEKLSYLNDSENIIFNPDVLSKDVPTIDYLSHRFKSLHYNSDVNIATLVMKAIEKSFVIWILDAACRSGFYRKIFKNRVQFINTHEAKAELMHGGKLPSEDWSIIEIARWVLDFSSNHRIREWLLPIMETNVSYYGPISTLRSQFKRSKSR